jgi:hypothetical protein
MVKLKKVKSKLFTNRVPIITLKDSQFQPDLFIAIKDGKIRIARIQETVDLHILLRQLDRLIYDLKDIKWAQDQRKAKK